ncbi:MULTISPECIES: hypothetical protein [unclassified Nocardioides]|uniref:hypothetical protein n=1 Tax=unclassified Nocardioides TaxID=2615069 RepID=UPI00361DF107
MTLTRLTLATASSVLLVATLAACGGDSSASDSGSDAGSSQGAPAGGMPARGGFPGASGEVAAVSGTTAQVQSQQSGQVAVTWTEDTAFTEQVDGTLDDVAVGSCVLVTTGDETAEDATEVTAATVRVTEATDDGGCGFGGAGGPGGPGGERPEGMPTDLPSDLPTDMPSDMPGGGRPGGFGTVGEVTAVSADGFTVSTTDPGSDETTEVDVSVDDATTYTTTAAAKSSAVQVGACVTARGESDDTGAVTADTISVSQPVDGECTGGFALGMRGAAGGDA